MSGRAQSTRSPRWRARKRWISAVTACLVFALAMAVWGAGKKKEASEMADPTPTREAGATAGQDASSARADTVRVRIQTVPARRAQVKWGRKRLGTIPAPRPLVVERPRDSGPMDLVIRASGYLPVHTRAYTFCDSRVAVKLTPLAEKNKLFGYREEPAPNPDGGLPAAPASTNPIPVGPPPTGPVPANPAPARPMPEPPKPQ